MSLFFYITGLTLTGCSSKGEDLDIDALKQAQLAFRQAEVEETVKVLQRLNNGEGGEIHQQNLRGEGDSLVSWEGMLQTKEMTIGGHSYGATLAVSSQCHYFHMPLSLT